MNEEGPKSAEQKTPLASATGAWARLSLLPKIVTGLGATLTALGTIFGTLLVFQDWWIKRFVEPVIIKDVQQEIEKTKGTLTSDIKSTITRELLEGEILRNRIQQQASQLFESSLKTKIGPMVEGRFTLDQAKPEEKVDVYWRHGYSAWLWVYLDALPGDDCILIQSPKVTSRPKHVMSLGLSKPINVAKMLEVQPGLQLASGQESEGDTVGPDKGIFDNIYQLTFRLGTKDNKAAKCGSDVIDKSLPVTVAYFMATAPLVSIPQIDEKDTQ